MTLGALAAAMPLVADQAGVWDGEYVHFDADHCEIDRHKSRLICRLFDGLEGEARLAQSNIYDWPDNSREIRFFDARLAGDRLTIANENINGWVGELGRDATNSTIMVLWTRADDASFRYYEMITLAEDRRAKNRTWHWYHEGKLFQRTLINEKKISDDWESYDDPAYLAYQPRAPR